MWVDPVVQVTEERWGGQGAKYQQGGAGGESGPSRQTATQLTREEKKRVDPTWPSEPKTDPIPILSTAPNQKFRQDETDTENMIQ